MDFRFDEEQVALRDAIRAFCQQHFALAERRGSRGPAADAGTWRALADMGVFGMLLPSERGGFGGGAIEAAIVFEQLGAHLATGPLLWSTIAAPLLPDVADRRDPRHRHRADVGVARAVRHRARRRERRRPRRRRRRRRVVRDRRRSPTRWTANRSIR